MNHSAPQRRSAWPSRRPAWYFVRQRLAGLAGRIPHRQRHIGQRLFGNLQVVTAHKLGMNAVLMASRIRPVASWVK